MVLFNDTQPPKPPTLFGKIITWLLRLVVLCVIFIAFFIGALNLLQGNGDTQKRGIEKTFSSFTNKDTYISTLHHLKLFPEFILEFDGLRNGMFSENKIHIDSVKFKAPGAIIIKKDGIFSDLNIQNVSFITGQTPVRTINSIETIDEEHDDPYIFVDIASPKPASLTISLDRVNAHYRVAEGIPFSLLWNDSGISGRFFNADGQSYITGAGKTHLPSLLPFLTRKGSMIECFIAQTHLKDYTLSFENVLIKTTNSPELQRIPSFMIDLFSKDIIHKERDKDETLYPDYPPNILLKSDCAQYTP